MTNPARFKLLSDDDGHDFIVPLEQQQAFDIWLQSVYDPMCEDLPMPDGITPLGGSPSLLTFTDPQLEQPAPSRKAGNEPR